MDSSVQHFLDLIRRSQRGKFKLYIGMIAGVGKSYRMLEELRQLLSGGIDARIGYIETHGRKETDEMAYGLPLIPRKKIFYHGKELEEMDIDAILREHPEVVIIDELAHTNVEGSKNEKRWQDVLDILDAGINVISAVNIQHLESLNHEVEQITGIEVTERIPDSVLATADEVVNIDLSAEDLIDRLKQGKIYTSDKIETALENFFQPDHILQLRELALKEVALKVEKKVELVTKENIGLRHEHFLACISSNEKSPRHIIRKVARLTTRHNASFSILYVRTPREQTDNISLADQRHLINNFKLATQLGGNVIQFDAKNVIEGIISVSLSHAITTVCIGRPRISWKNMIQTAVHYRHLFNSLAKSKIDLIIMSE
jgi:two-component system sensor histidine kinase KdpD